MMKKLLSSFLSICLLATLVPSAVSAEDSIISYKVWVGGDEVTSNNLVGDDWSYNSVTSTLTLTNATITGTHIDQTSEFGIYATGSGTLTLNLVGNNSITMPATSTASSYGIYAKRPLAITGSGGSLTVTGGNTTKSGSQSHGVYGVDSITVSGVSLTATGGTAADRSEGICTDKYITIESGTVIAAGRAASNSTGIRTAPPPMITTSMTIKGGTVTATGEAIGGTTKSSYGIYSTSVIAIEGGTVTAKGGTAAMNKAPVLTSYPTQHYVLAGASEAAADVLPSDPTVATYRYLKIAPGTVPTPYDIWVGGVRVTSVNAGDVLDDGGSVSYNNGSQTLTLDGVTLSDPQGNENGVAGIFIRQELILNLVGANNITMPSAQTAIGSYGIYSNSDLTIAGNGSLEVTGGDLEGPGYSMSNGIYSMGSITVDSGVTLTATGGTATNTRSYGIRSEEGITINGGTVIATGGFSNASYGMVASGYSTAITIKDGTVIATGRTYGMYYGGDDGGIIINGGTVTAKGEEAAMYPAPVLGGSYPTPRYILGGDSEEDFNIITNISAASSVRYFKVAPGAAPTVYNIWVGGVRITSLNKGNVLPGGVNEGKVSYEPTGQTLTLDGVEITNTYNLNQNMECGIYANALLTLELSGANYITMPSTSTNVSYGIRTMALLTIEGNGSLTVTGGDTPQEAGCQSVGIYTAGKVIVKDGGITLTATGGASDVSEGIRSPQDIIINGSTVTAAGGSASTKSGGITVNGPLTTLTINNGTVTATGGSAPSSYGIYSEKPSDGIIVNGGTVTAKGENASMNRAPVLTRYSGHVITASENASGVSAVNYIAGDINSYKYLRIAPPPTVEELVIAAKAAAEGANYPASVTQASAPDEETLESTLLAIAKAAVGNSTIDVEITDGSYTPPVAGTSAALSGTKGSYSFKVTVSKGGVEETTAVITVDIIATPYPGGATPTVPSTPSAPSTPYVPPIVVKPEASSGSVAGSSVSLALAQFPSGVSEDEVIFSAKLQSVTSIPVQAVEAALAAQTILPAAKGITAYDLAFVLKSTGAKVNFTGKVTVTLPIPKGYSNYLRVFHVADNGAMTEVPAVINGSNLLLTLSHFSYYAIVDFASPAGKLPADLTAKAPVTTTVAETAKPSPNGNAATNPRTGVVAIPAGAILLALACVTVSRKHRAGKKLTKQDVK